jgi:hypothetical protein
MTILQQYYWNISKVDTKHQIQPISNFLKDWWVINKVYKFYRIDLLFYCYSYLPLVSVRLWNNVHFIKWEVGLLFVNFKLITMIGCFFIMVTGILGCNVQIQI